MALVDQIDIAGTYVASGVRGSNTIGTPVLSAVLLGTGEEISDDYILTISARAGGTGTVTVSASVNNPYNGRVVTLVPFDDLTVVSLVVPGVGIVFDNAAVDANTAIVNIGDFQGTFDASGVGAGVPTVGEKHRVLNNGASGVSGAIATLLDQAIWTRQIGRVFDYVKPFAEGATEKVAGGGSEQTTPYVMTIAGVAGVGAAKTANLLVDGVLLGAASILDLTTGTAVSGTGLKAISRAYGYKIITGPLTGVEFALHADVVNANSAKILIFPSRYVQIAPDSGGVAGTYGVVDVNLTQAGQATGVINAAGFAHYWVRLLVPQSANNESNPYPCNVALQANVSSSAGW